MWKELVSPHSSREIVTLFASLHWQRTKNVDEYSRPRNIETAVELLLANGKLNEWRRGREFNVETYYQILRVHALLSKPGRKTPYWSTRVTAFEASLAKQLDTYFSDCPSGFVPNPYPNAILRVFDAIVQHVGYAVLKVDATPTTEIFDGTLFQSNCRTFVAWLKRRFIALKKRCEEFSKRAESAAKSPGMKDNYWYHYALAKTLLSSAQEYVQNLEKAFSDDRIQTIACGGPSPFLSGSGRLGIEVATLDIVVLSTDMCFTYMLGGEEESTATFYLNLTEPSVESEHSIFKSKKRLAKTSIQLSNLKTGYQVRSRHSSERHIARRIFSS